MSRQRSMALIGYGPFFTALVNRIKSYSPDSNLTQAIIGEAPLEQRMSIGTALAQMIRSNGPRLYAPALQAVQKEHGKLAGEALDAVCLPNLTLDVRIDILLLAAAGRRSPLDHLSSQFYYGSIETAKGVCNANVIQVPILSILS